MRILGVQFESHDSGVAVIEDGKILYAANEERFSRIKMDSATPFRSLASALQFLKLDYQDFDVLAFSGIPPSFKKIFSHFWQQNQRIWFTRFGYLYSFLNPFHFDWGRLLRQTGISAIFFALSVIKDTKRIIKLFRDDGFRGKIMFFEHDLCHAASAYYTSGFDQAFVAIYEGSSLFNTCSFWQGTGGELKKAFEVPLPHSPGRYYEVVTRILGFHPKKHGGKITGLAGFGNWEKCYSKVRELLWCEGLQIRVGRKLYTFIDEYFRRGRKIPREFESYRREDIAAAFQKRLEDVVIEQLKNVARHYDITNLALAGGVVANVKLNMEIMKLPEVKNVFVHPGMGDVGQALGAAFIALAKLEPNFRPIKLHDGYLGPSYSDLEIRKDLEKSGLKYRRASNLAKEVALYLSESKVIGLFQGRMEYGPRALGNRSILYPATDRQVNDWLNKRLKRTEFMPFAPVTLAERAKECYLFLEKSWNSAEYMTMAFPTTSYMQSKMPAAVHVDDTARPQIIRREVNPLYYDILKEYEKITGLPSLINTSFNMHEEPIVCTPEEAITAFKQSRLGYLVIGNYISWL